MGILYDRNILSVIVEGGARVLGSFIGSGLWDEARVITGDIRLGGGLAEPDLNGQTPVDLMEVEGDQIRFFENKT